jgi:hypothetical protein
MGWVARIARRRPADWGLAFEALLLLTSFRLALAWFPASTILGRLTRGAGAEAAYNATGQQMRMVRRVQWAVSAAARHSPVEFVCFPQALAGYWMLRRRGVAATLVYGVARSQTAELQAHTWLSVGESIVLGGETAERFTPMERWT